MDRNTELKLAGRIAEWRKTENPNLSLVLADDILNDIMDEIELDAELGGWYSELELAQEGVIFIDGDHRNPEVQEALLPGNPEAHIVCLNDMLSPDDEEYLAVYNDGLGHVRTFETDSLADFTVGKWRVHLVLPGEGYGVDNAVPYSQEDADRYGNGLPLVEFFDISQDPERFPGGQFVSRYYMSTLTGADPFGGGFQSAVSNGIGFSLDLGIPAWTVKPDELKPIAAWLENAEGVLQNRRDTPEGEDLENVLSESVVPGAHVEGQPSRSRQGHEVL